MSTTSIPQTGQQRERAAETAATAVAKEEKGNLIPTAPRGPLQSTRGITDGGRQSA